MTSDLKQDSALLAETIDALHDCDPEHQADYLIRTRREVASTLRALLRALDAERARVAELEAALINLNAPIDRMWNDTEGRVVSERHALDITHAQRAAAATLAKETP